MEIENFTNDQLRDVLRGLIKIQGDGLPLSPCERMFREAVIAETRRRLGIH